MPPITRTIASFTQHNVSSAPTYNQAHFATLFTGKTNHDGTIIACDPSKMDDSQNASSPIVISKESLRTLMPAGWTGRIACHSQAWWNIGSHPDIGIDDRDAATMAAIMADLKARGYDVFIPDWYHPTKSTVLNDASLDVIFTAAQGAGMKVMIMIDQQYFGNSGSTAATVQADIITAINHLMDKYAANSAYEKFTKAGVPRPLILLWDVDGQAKSMGTTIDWNAVRSAVTSHSNPLLIQYQASGFGLPASDGALAWTSSNADTATRKSGVNYLLNSFLPAVKSHPTLIALSSVIKGFNGTLTGPRPTASGFNSWSLGKFTDQQDGFTWVDWWAENAKFVAAGNKLDYVCTITLDDFQEGSAVQCGIRTAVKINAALSGNVITFSVTGDERTMRQYNLWGTLDGVNVTQLASVLPGVAKQFDLAKLPGLTQDGNYTLYVEAQGMPSLENQMAPQTFTQPLTVGGGVVTPPPPPPPPTPTPGTSGPVAILTVDNPSGVTPFVANFDGSQSYDLNAAITQYRFDFGDGTAPQIGPALNTAQHTYTKAGTFLAQLTITDANGANGIATVTITVTAPEVTTTPAGGLPGPPPPPPPLPTGDPKNPIQVTTPAPVPTPDPRRELLPALPRSQQERMTMLSELQELMRTLQANKVIANALMSTNAIRGRELMQNTIKAMSQIDAWGKQVAAAAKVTWKW
jgi:hypothetical protein